MKKLLSVLLMACLLVSVLAVPAMAEENGKCVVVEKIEEEVRELQVKTLYAMVYAANASVEQLVAIAQATPYNDIAWLQASVRAVTNPVFAYAKAIGATVECTYVTYYIDGQYVAVDPLRVINVI